MKVIWSRYVIHFIGRRIKITHALSIADKCIKEDVHWQSNLRACRDVRQKIYSVGRRQTVTFPEGIDLYFN